MENSKILQSYFKEQNQKTPDDFKIEDWTKQEGLVWVNPHSLPKVLEKIWHGFDPRPTLMTHVGNDERNLGNGFVLYLLFHFQGDFVLTIGSRGIEGSYPSLTAICPALNWPEREVRDLLGVVPEGHPDPRPLVLHPGWPEDFYPLRKIPDHPPKDVALYALPKELISKDCHQDNNSSKDTTPNDQIPSFTPQPLSFVEAQGEGTFEIPVGPIHAGIIEPGHFRFQTVGETILHLDAQLFYTHKGVEKLLEGKSLEEGLKIVERVCGVCSLSHSLAYCEAVEKLKGIQVSREVLGWRTVLGELERLYNHIGDIGNLCAGAGVALGTSNGLQSKEELQRLNQEIFGHRFLRGTVTIGGVRK
ncbi:MAG: formate hydrogenlyase, partial [Desulfitobacterium sp.]|nr:formate hydrogenlyase [Desulfitobacterium sp.]